MQIKNLFVFACLLAASLLRANNTPTINPGAPEFTQSEESCELPAPLKFHVVEHLHQSVSLAWELTNPLYQHRIRAYRRDWSLLGGDTLILVQTITVDAGVTEATMLFINGFSGLIKINAICTSRESPNEAWVTAYPPVGYILELIITGYTQGSNGSNCSLSQIQGGERCYYPSTGTTTFRVRKTDGTNFHKVFNMETIFNPGTNSRHKLKLNDGEGNQEGNTDYFNFYVDNKPPPSSGQQYQIRYNNVVVARFFADKYTTTGESYLQSIFIMPGFEIIQMNAEGQARPSGPGNERNELISNSSSQPATVSPNPFSNNLDVYLAQNAAEQVHLQLFNLAGQKVLAQQFTGGQAQYSLSTASLSPGFYLLRIEADGEVQTLKVVKSE